MVLKQSESKTIGGVWGIGGTTSTTDQATIDKLNKLEKIVKTDSIVEWGTPEVSFGTDPDKERYCVSTDGIVYEAIVPTCSLPPPDETQWKTRVENGLQIMFLKQSVLNPANINEPTLAEFKNITDASNLKNILIYYTATDTSTDPIVKEALVDKDGDLQFITGTDSTVDIVSLDRDAL